MNWKQEERQKHRNQDGKYSQVNPCYRCGKSAGADYFSGPYVDRDDETGRKWNDEMLCLCEPCAGYMEQLDVAEIVREVDGASWGRLPRAKKAAAPTVQELTPWERDCWEVENREQQQAERANRAGRHGL